MTYFERNLTCE